MCTCYEAGRDGFWLHRALTKLGIVNIVVDASSNEVNRRQKQVKSDPVDAGKLVNMVCRYHAGERKVRYADPSTKDLGARFWLAIW